MFPGEGGPGSVGSSGKQGSGEEGGQGLGEEAGTATGVQPSTERRGVEGLPRPFHPFPGGKFFSILTVSTLFHRFTTKKGHKVCAKPQETWVQKYISLLKAQKQL